MQSTLFVSLNSSNTMLPAVAVSKMPLLFSTPMVEAILNDLKSVTRRLKGLENINNNPEDWRFLGIYEDGYAHFESLVTGIVEKVKNPYSKDFIWVRETWSKMTDSGYWFYIYRTSDSWGDAPDDAEIKWKPSIHMPFDACRLWLQVKSVTVERLQDITEEQAQKEGVMSTGAMSFGKTFRAYIDYMNEGMFYDCALNSFESLWQKINGNWNLNPFVWVIEFERCSKP